MKSLVSKWKAWWDREELEWVKSPTPCTPPARDTELHAEVKRLQEELEEERKLREMAQREAAVATARQGRLARMWPAIHQQFFTKEGEAALKSEANEKRKRRKKPCSKIAH